MATDYFGGSDADDGLELGVAGSITLRPPTSDARVVLVGQLGAAELSDVRYAVAASAF